MCAGEGHGQSLFAGIQTAQSGLRRRVLLDSGQTLDILRPVSIV